MSDRLKQHVFCHQCTRIPARPRGLPAAETVKDTSIIDWLSDLNFNLTCVLYADFGRIQPAASKFKRKMQLLKLSARLSIVMRVVVL